MGTSGLLIWCKVIAWINMVGRILLGSLLTVVAVHFFGHPEIKQVPVGFLWFSGAVFALFYLLIAIGFGFDLVLWKGANERNVYYLRIWIYFACLFFVANVLAMFSTRAQQLDSWLIAAHHIDTIYNGFAIIIVFLANSEIKGNNVTV